MPRVLNKRYDYIPPGAVYVGRPSIYGNHFKAGTREENVRRYSLWIMGRHASPLRQQMKRELVGKDLICWCAPELCHAEVILAIANGSH